MRDKGTALASYIASIPTLGNQLQEISYMEQG